MKSELNAIHKRLGEIFENTKFPTQVTLVINDSEGEVPSISYTITEMVLTESTILPKSPIKEA